MFSTPTIAMRRPGGIASFSIRPLVRRFRRWREIHTTVRALEALDDHVLRDVGIPRGLIEDEVRRRLDAGPRG